MTGWAFVEYCTGVLTSAFPYVLLVWGCCCMACGVAGVVMIRKGTKVTGWIGVAASALTIACIA
ncbi:MAG TPA: hypothetical protein QGH10_24975 [Armatimonadota bacterium]|nr:hypothetical protein [Armatimonadota bacterium]